MEDTAKTTDSTTIDTLKDELLKSLQESFNQIREQEHKRNEKVSRLSFLINELSGVIGTSYFSKQAIKESNDKKADIKDTCQKLSTLFPGDENVKAVISEIQPYLAWNTAFIACRKCDMKMYIKSLGEIIVALSDIDFEYR